MEANLVSILMTCYNREAFIAEAIESVLNSDYKFFELIIVDDRSIDNTVNIVKSYADKDKRIRFYTNEHNLGDYPNRNKAASYARGKYLMFCDSDDCFFIDSISYCVSQMENNPAAKIGFYEKEGFEKVTLMKPEIAIYHHFFIRPLLNIGPGGIIINRQYFNSQNKFPIKYGPANDMYFNLKVAASSPVLALPKLFLKYRRHEGQEINNEFVYLYQNYNYLKDALAELPLKLTAKQILWISKKNKRRFMVNLIRFYFNSFNYNKTMYAIKQSGFRFKDVFTAIFQF